MTKLIIYSTQGGSKKVCLQEEFSGNDSQGRDFSGRGYHIYHSRSVQMLHKD